MIIDMLRVRMLLLLVVVNRRGWVVGIGVVTRWHVRGGEWENGWWDSIVVDTGNIWRQTNKNKLLTFKVAQF